MALIVQKFGGSSVADADKIRNVARIITETYRRGHSVLAVLSAQGDTTDDLIEKSREINRNPSRREMDMLLSTGEQISIALCAMAIERMGYQAVSLTGWQAGMLTDSTYGSARLRRLNKERVDVELDKIIQSKNRYLSDNKIVVPIISQGDPIGSITILPKDSKSLGDPELKVAEIGAYFLARQMEN